MLKVFEILPDCLACCEIIWTGLNAGPDFVIVRCN